MYFALPFELLLKNNWEAKIQSIESTLTKGLKDCLNFPHVKDVRVLGAIGVVELDQPLNLDKFQQKMVANGVWVRPFMNLIYVLIYSSNVSGKSAYPGHSSGRSK